MFYVLITEWSMKFEKMYSQFILLWKLHFVAWTINIVFFGKQLIEYHQHVLWYLII